MQLELVVPEIVVKIDDVEFIFDQVTHQDIAIVADKNTGEKKARIISKLKAIRGEILIGGEQITVEKFKELFLGDKLRIKFMVDLIGAWGSAVLESHGYIGDGVEEKNEGAAV